MTELIICLSTGQGTWGHVGKIVQDKQWSKIFLITNTFGKEKFSKPENAEFIVVNTNQDSESLKQEIYLALKGKVKGPEVGINMVSGSGNEHMALISSILKLGVGLRLVVNTKEGTKEL